MLLLGMLLGALTGCGKGAAEQSSGGPAADYTPGAGMVLEYAPQGELEALHPDTGDTGSGDTGDTGSGDTGGDVATIRLVVNDTLWDFEDDSGSIGALDYRMDSDGLWVGQSHVLPPNVGIGATSDGVTVTDVGAVVVWYGTFDPAGTVTVDGGELAGTAVFAQDLGPILLSYAGQVWELVYYERPSGG